MEILNLFWNRPGDIFRIIELCKKNKIIVGTSDTVLGLLAPLTKEGFNLLNLIKERYEKPYIVLIGDHNKLNHFVRLPLSNSVQLLIEQCWPGPLTLILNAKEDSPSFLISANGAIAVRMPDHRGLQEVLRSFDGLFSTSANKAGSPIPVSVDEIDTEILNKASALVLDAPSQKDVTSLRPSTILDCTGDVIRVIREGVYSVEKLERIAGERFER